MNNKPLDELYFVWLYRQVGDPELQNPNRTYWRLLKQLYNKEFVWWVANDDNRIEDGKDLRFQFVEDDGVINVDPAWMRLGCSMLEMLIGLSRRLAFETDGEPHIWFWHLMHNLGLMECNDGQNYRSERSIDDALDRVIWRTYHEDGRGGLFPLQSAREDQRRVEIWYQLSAYILERT